MGLIVKLAKLDPLFDALSLFSPITKTVELRFKPAMLTVIATAAPHGHSPRFVATLQISWTYFSTYIVDDTHSFEVDVKSFRDRLISNAGSTTTLTMLLVEGLNKLALRFHEPSVTNLKPLIRELRYSPSEGEELGDVDSQNYFKIRSSELRRIIKKLPLFKQHSVCVTVTSSQVKFSAGSNEIVVTKESGIGEIEGFEVETELQVVFVPMLFFIDLTYINSEWIWFYKKINSGCLIMIPIHGSKLQYVIHFPQK